MDYAITWSFERERHQLKHNTKPNSLSVGDVVIIKSDERDRNQWPMGVVEELFIGRDGIVRAAKLRAGRGFIKRPIQHPYTLQWHTSEPYCSGVPAATRCCWGSTSANTVHCRARHLNVVSREIIFSYLFQFHPHMPCSQVQCPSNWHL